jgi:uncharacterized protein with PIN domain
MDNSSTPAEEVNQYRFFADVMLGTLARWLRILGFDTSYENFIEDDDLIRICRLERRIALTRDKRLAKRKDLKPCLFIEGNTLSEQLTEVLEFTGGAYDPASLLSRCLECNSPIEEVKKATVEEEVPPYVFRTQGGFRRCPDCGRIYWAGTHRERILERLRKLIGTSILDPPNQVSSGS